MKEADLYYPFTQKFLIREPDAFVYKIPDTGQLGGLKPFDFFIVTKGIPFAVEFKIDKEEPTRYQWVKLNQFSNAGGVSCVYQYPKETIAELINRIVKLRNNKIKKRREDKNGKE